MRSTLLTTLMIGALLCACVYEEASARVPRLINYQGYLTDDEGEPIGGVQSIEFTIYDSETEGSQLWNEKQNVMVMEGLFNVLLGTVNLIPYEIFGGGERYLAVRVGGGAELSPRQRLVSVSYAFKANDADQLGGRVADDFVRRLGGIAPENGDVDLVAGSNVTIEKDAANHRITISAATGSGGLTLPFSSTISNESTAFTVRNTGDGMGILASSSSTHGLRGQSGGSSGYGVYGVANGATARGVVGSAIGANGYGEWGLAANYHGVHGSSTRGTGVYGVQGDSDNHGYLGGSDFGAYGEHEDSGNFGWLGGRNEGVSGESDTGRGVLGISRTSDGVHGASTSGPGVRGRSDDGHGVHGSTDRFSRDAAGVYGDGAANGVHGVGSVNGVFGESNDGSGVHGQSDSGTAVLAEGDLRVTGAYRGDISSNSTTDGAPFPRPAYTSGWTSINQGQTITLNHGIGGNPDYYFVDLQFQGPTLGTHIRALGADAHSLTSNYGAYWRNLTDEEIRITRFSHDSVVSSVRVRIWLIR